MDDNVVYLDYNATTPLDKTVIEVMTSALSNLWHNPSSNYECGVQAKRAVEESRQKVGQMLGCCSPADEIIFTSGGTEANNWLFYSCAKEFEKLFTETGTVPNIVTTNVEHDSVAEALNHLSSQKHATIETTFVPVTRDIKSNYFTIDTQVLLSSVKDNTVLISVMLANNETGFIQNIADIGSALEKLNVKRLESNLPKVYLHTDAAQAIGKIEVNVQQLKVDYLTIVGHKFYGPRIGALYFRKGSPLHPLFVGGGQERSLRPGTENTACIVGLGEAAYLVTQNLSYYHKHFMNIRCYLEAKLEETFGEMVTINGKNVQQRLPNTVSVSFNNPSLKGYLILKYAKRVNASVGAACHSNSEQISRVLLACGISRDAA
ncbi:selenocysteine lyase-like protein, partial [Leptotrombidium deliense]